MMERAGQRDYAYMFLLLYISILILVAATTPITPSEAYLFYQKEMTATTLLMHAGQYLVSNELGMRLFFLCLGFLNGMLFYAIMPTFFSREEDRRLATLFYLLLPGVVTSTLLANDAVVIASQVLLFLFLYLRERRLLSLVPLFLLSFVHWSALYFYMILFLYGIFQKKGWVAFVSFSLMPFSLFFSPGMPQEEQGNYFIELLGIDVMIFSPLFFIYLFYALYRTLLRGKRELLWYISFGALILSFGLSLQARIKITDFSAYMMLGTAVAIQTYLVSYRVRLPLFRSGYRLLFRVVFLSLVLSTLSIILHRPLYRLLGKIRYPVVAPVYEPFDKAKTLKRKDKDCTAEPQGKALYQLRYYGVKKCF